MVDQSGTSVYSYTDAGLLQSEDGPWVNDVVSYTYNNRLRSAMTVGLPSGSVLSTSYGYDAIKRLTNITSWAGTFVYGYSNNPATEVLKITLPNSAYITNTYDNVARELSTTLYNSSATALNTHTYLYDKAGQRTNQTYTTGNYDRYTYDGIGQLLTASGYESGGTARSQEQLKYKYDAAGNLSVRTNNALVQTFNADTLNQLSTITRTGTLTVSGTASSTAVTNVTVNTTNASIYADATFAATNFTPSDGYNTYTAIAQDTYGRKATNTITVYLPATETYKYDANGNLTNDAVWAYRWDGENRLIQASNVDISTLAMTNRVMVNLTYDFMGRRATKSVCTNNGTVWTTNTVRYIYDLSPDGQGQGGWNLLAVMDAQGNLVQSYIWGQDLSGTMNGAGGIGGLVGVTEVSNNTVTNCHYTAFDGNGNITALVRATDHTTSARYEYSPFGQLIRSTGVMAKNNPFRFSTKYWDDETDLVYYGYRYYSPSLGRWINRDPSEEDGGNNLYTFIENCGPNDFDLDGLAKGGKKNLGVSGYEGWSAEELSAEAKRIRSLGDRSKLKHAEALEAAAKRLKQYDTRLGGKYNRSMGKSGGFATIDGMMMGGGASMAISMILTKLNTYAALSNVQDRLNNGETFSGPDADLASFVRNADSGNTAWADLDAITYTIETSGGDAMGALVTWDTLQEYAQ